MTKEDVKKLFTYLETLCPREQKKSRDNATLTAWAMVLSPYGYDEVIQAATARSRENRFFPDPAELVAYLPEASAPPLTAAHREGDVEKMLALAEETEARYRDAGLPTPSEARDQGWTEEKFVAACREAGI